MACDMFSYRSHATRSLRQRKLYGNALTSVCLYRVRKTDTLEMGYQTTGRVPYMATSD